MFTTHLLQQPLGQEKESKKLTLRNHLDVDSMITQRREHLARNTNHVLHLRTDQTQNGQTVQHAHVATIRQVPHRRVKVRNIRVAHVHRHGNVHFRSRNQVHADLVLVEDGKKPRKEMVRDRPLVGVDVDDGDLVLDGDGRGALGLVALEAGRAVGGGGSVGAAVGAAVLLVALERLVGRQQGIGLDNGALTARVLDVLDADRDRGSGLDHLVHG